MKEDRYFYIFDVIENLRADLIKNENEIDLKDFGAGTKMSQSHRKTISSIAQSSLSLPYQCRVMFRLIEQFKPKTILELGTSLGISTSYLASANKASNVITLEGDQQSLSIAEQVFKGLKLENIKSIHGPFSQTLAPVLEKLKIIDAVFMDGHHDKEATIDYFNQIINYCNEKSFIIIDDIYWSQGMEEAWAEIKNHQRVTLSLDLFFCGIVFFKKENLEKEHFKLKPGKFLFFR